MSDDKKKDLAKENNAADHVEVDELDDKALESASGGAEISDESQIGDVNQLQCYC